MHLSITTLRHFFGLIYFLVSLLISHYLRYSQKFWLRSRLFYHSKAFVGKNAWEVSLKTARFTSSTSLALAAPWLSTLLPSSLIRGSIVYGHMSFRLRRNQANLSLLTWLLMMNPAEFLFVDVGGTQHRLWSFIVRFIYLTILTFSRIRSCMCNYLL